jgi:hypothetical protein
MNKLVLIVILVAFVFIVTYDPKKGKKFLPLEKYRSFDPPSVPGETTCDEAKYLQLQGLSGATCAGRNKEHLGAVYESPNMGASMSRVVGYDLE